MYSTTSHKSRQLDSLQQVMSAFKQFEKKFNKLQEDVSYHGQTLTELRIMVANLAVPVDARASPEGKKQLTLATRRSTAVLYEDRSLEEHTNVKRRTLQHTPNRIKAKSMMSPKSDTKESLLPPFFNKSLSSPKTTKHSARPSKAGAPRKATTLRSQKGKVEKRRTKPKK